MNKPTLVFFSVLAGYMLAGCNSGRTDNSVMPRQDTWDRTLGFLLYVDAHATQTGVQSNSPNYSFVWNAENWADDFRTTNSQSSLGNYALSASVDYQDARPDPLLPADGPASRLRTLQWWLYEADGVGHPDWVLYQCDGVTPAYQYKVPPDTYPNMPLDITNPAVIAWQVHHAGTFQSTVTALSVDYFSPANLNHACGVYRNGQWVQLFAGEDYDPAFNDALFNWAQEVRRRLAVQKHPKGLVVNCSPVPGYEDQTIATLAASVDGVLDEYGFTYWDDAFRDIWWPIKIKRMIEIQNQGGAYYSVNYVPRFPPTKEEVNWILGSYLMAREHSAYIAITEQPTETYLYPPWPDLPEYHVDVGQPCGAMTTSQGVYVRDFSKGMALVNPSRLDSFTVALPPGNFTDLGGARVAGNVFLGPLSGQVLLSSQARCR